MTLPWYLIFKWWHLIAMVSWMAGVLYLIRLLVYHSTPQGKKVEVHELLSTMERRLALYILRPAMALTWITGLSMVIINPLLGHQPWFMSKLVCVIILSFVSEWAGGYRKRLLKETTKPLLSSRALKYINEIPTLLMIIIIALVIFRPWS